MTVTGVGPGAGGPLLPKAGATGDAPADPSAGGSDPGAQGDSLTTKAAGTTSLIGADGKVRTGWGVVDAPPQPPIRAFGNEVARNYGTVDVPSPKPDAEGGVKQTAELPRKPEEPKANPIRRNKFSIVTGPPQGDP